MEPTKTFDALFDNMRRRGLSPLSEPDLDAFTHARLELDRKIDDDIALLVRAGVALGRISMQVIPESGEQRLLVGETVVQRYKITPTVDGQPLEVLR